MIVVKALDWVQEIIQIILRCWVLFLLCHSPSATTSKLLIIWEAKNVLTDLHGV